MILKIGGNTPRNSIHRALERIISNKCAISCSWKGVRSNYKICNLTFIKNIRGKYFKIIFNLIFLNSVILGYTNVHFLLLDTI